MSLIMLLSIFIGASSTATFTLPSPGSERSIGLFWMVRPFSWSKAFDLGLAHRISTRWGQRLGINCTPTTWDTFTNFVISLNISLMTADLLFKSRVSVANCSIKLDSIFPQTKVHTKVGYILSADRLLMQDMSLGVLMSVLYSPVQQGRGIKRIDCPVCLPLTQILAILVHKIIISTREKQYIQRLIQ